MYSELCFLAWFQFICLAFKELFRIVASLGASLLAETLQQRVLANARMSLAGLVLIEKKWLLCFPFTR